jgi:hypothetical protein
VLAQPQLRRAGREAQYNQALARRARGGERGYGSAKAGTTANRTPPRRPQPRVRLTLPILS